MMTRVLVCGGRDYQDRTALYAALDRLHAERCFAVVITGGARGADMLAADWAAVRDVATDTYHANWRFGRKAGPIRNKRMLDEGRPDVVIAFPGGCDTAGVIALARAAGVEVVAAEAMIGPAHWLLELEKL
ncbi:MAG TPA: DUF2493 domain-containing protein [Xanthobacteraceae bacterium]|jgi:hypothetical protein